MEGCLSRAGGLACITPVGVLDETIDQVPSSQDWNPKFWSWSTNLGTMLGKTVRGSACFCLGVDFRGMRVFRTSATSAESSISVATRFAHTNHLSVDVRCAVGVDVARATAAMGDFGS